jgi:hypothetical protein
MTRKKDGRLVATRVLDNQAAGARALPDPQLDLEINS